MTFVEKKNNQNKIILNWKGKVLDQISKIYQDKYMHEILFFQNPSYLLGVTLKVTPSNTFFFEKKI